MDFLNESNGSDISYLLDVSASLSLPNDDDQGNADPAVAPAKHPGITRGIGQVLGPVVALGYHPRIPRAVGGPVAPFASTIANLVRGRPDPWIPKSVARPAVARADHPWIPRAATGPVVARTDHPAVTRAVAGPAVHSGRIGDHRWFVV
jgi:hypothetical protein